MINLASLLPPFFFPSLCSPKGGGTKDHSQTESAESSTNEDVAMPKKKCREEGEKKFFLVRFLGKHALCSRRRRRLPITILRVRGEGELGFQKSCSPLLLQQQRTELSKKFFPSTRSTLDVAPVRRRAHSLVNVRGGNQKLSPPPFIQPPSLPRRCAFSQFCVIL